MTQRSSTGTLDGRLWISGADVAPSRDEGLGEIESHLHGKGGTAVRESSAYLHFCCRFHGSSVTFCAAGLNPLRQAGEGGRIHFVGVTPPTDDDVLAALVAIRTGDLAALRNLIDAHPGLATSRLNGRWPLHTPRRGGRRRDPAGERDLVAQGARGTF